MTVRTEGDADHAQIDAVVEAAFASPVERRLVRDLRASPGYVPELTFVSINPSLMGPYTALPIQIFQWIGRPQEEFKFLAAAAIIVLLLMLLSLNAVAIWLRNRYQKRW